MSHQSAVSAFTAYAKALPELLDALMPIRETRSVLPQLRAFKEYLVAEQDFELAKICRELGSALQVEGKYDRIVIVALVAKVQRDAA
jgi:hypothetical protein